MKKTALRGLIVLFAIKSVSACERLVDPNHPIDPSIWQAAAANTAFYIKIFFYSLIFLILANFILFFIRKKYDAFVLIALIVITLLMFPFLLVGAVASDCDALILRFVLLSAVLVFLTIFCLHLALWIKNLEVEWSIANIGDIKLR